MKTVIITGVAGFLGSHVARQFSQNGWGVVGVDVVAPENARIGTQCRYVQLSLPSAELAPLPRQLSQLANGAMLVVIVGQTFHGTLAAAPIDATPKRERPNITYGPNASIDELRERRKRVPFPLMVPTIIERSSWADSTMPARMYWIDPDEKHKAVRLVYHMGSNEYWGVEETDWDDAPVLDDKSLTRRIKGRTYDLYYNGAKLHMVVLRTPSANYWVINTLLDRLSNETMLAIAKGLKPLGSVKAK